MVGQLTLFSLTSLRPLRFGGYPVLSILSPSPYGRTSAPIEPFVYSPRRHTVGSQKTRRHSAESEPYPKLPSASSTVQRHSKVPVESFRVAAPLDSQMAGAVFSSSVTRNSDRTKPSKASCSSTRGQGPSTEGHEGNGIQPSCAEGKSMELPRAANRFPTSALTRTMTPLGTELCGYCPLPLGLTGSALGHERSADRGQVVMNSACLGRKKWAYVDGRWYRLRDVGGRPVSQPRLRQMDMEQSLVLQRCFLNLAGDRFAEGKSTKLSSAWTGRHEEVLKVPFL